MTTLSPSRPRVRPGRLTLWAGFAVALTALNLRTAVTGFTPLLEMVGADLAQRLSLRGGEEVTVSTATGSITLPAVVGGVSDGTVWLPECSAGSTVHQTLGAGHGSRVTVTHAAEVLR